MGIKTLGLMLVVICAVPAASVAQAADEAAAKAAALKAAQSWLKIVDDGKYAESWDDSAPVVKAAVTRDRMVQLDDAVRKPLGAVDSRAVSSEKYSTSLPGAPDGQYVVIQFSTSFANKKVATETVALALDKDGVWQVSGYHIA